MIGPIGIPFPDPLLNPNARAHWSKKAKAAKIAREQAFWSVRRIMGPTKPDWQRVRIAYKFHPPDKRRRDLDNLIASTKAISDGIADAIGIDDSRFIPTYSMAEPIKGGAVILTLGKYVPLSDDEQELRRPVSSWQKGEAE